jgi:hypothetical protein
MGERLVPLSRRSFPTMLRLGRPAVSVAPSRASCLAHQRDHRHPSRAPRRSLCVYGHSMNWETVLVSAAISTVVSALITLLMAGRVAIRQRRAEAAEAGLVELRTTVDPWRLEVTQYGLGMANSLRRDSSASHGDDHARATQVMNTALKLRRVRRWLVRRRCRAVFGAYWTTLAEQMPWNGESDTYPLVAHLTNALALNSWGAHRLNGSCDLGV